jgi:hypothetical protein
MVKERVMAKRFEGSTKAKKNLGVRKKQWDVLGELANIHPLQEGRHRGNHAGELRPGA